MYHLPCRCKRVWPTAAWSGERNAGRRPKWWWVGERVWWSWWHWERGSGGRPRNRWAWTSVVPVSNVRGWKLSSFGETSLHRTQGKVLHYFGPPLLIFLNVNLFIFFDLVSLPFIIISGYLLALRNTFISLDFMPLSLLSSNDINLCWFVYSNPRPIQNLDFRFTRQWWRLPSHVCSASMESWPEPEHGLSLTGQVQRPRPF